jgi:molybdopterin biosynthesis enzyme
MLSELALADALIVRQPSAPAAEIGQTCEVLLLY